MKYGIKFSYKNQTVLVTVEKSGDKFHIHEHIEGEDLDLSSNKELAEFLQLKQYAYRALNKRVNGLGYILLSDKDPSEIEVWEKAENLEEDSCKCDETCNCTGCSCLGGQ